MKDRSGLVTLVFSAPLLRAPMFATYSCQCGTVMRGKITKKIIETVTFFCCCTLCERGGGGGGWVGGLLWWLGKGWDGWSPTEIKCPPPFNLFNLIYTNALSNSKTDMVFAQASIQPALSQRSVWSQWRSTLTDAEVLCSGFIANVYSIVKEKGDPQHWVQARRHHAVTDYNSPLV